MNLEARQKDIY